MAGQILCGELSLLGGAQSRVSAPPHQKEPANVVRASGQDSCCRMYFRKDLQARSLTEFKVKLGEVAVERENSGLEPLTTMTCTQMDERSWRSRQSKILHVLTPN